MLRTRSARKRKKYWQQEERKKYWPKVVAHLNEALDALLAGGWGWRNIIKINTTTINNNNKNTGSTNKNTSTRQHANKKQAPSNKQQQQQKLRLGAYLRAKATRRPLVA